MTPHLSVIIPAYNEEKRIPKTLRDFSSYFDSQDLDYEILVIMDGITDNTRQVVEAEQAKNPRIRFKEYPEKQGKGGALLKGFGQAQGDIISYTDADGATSPQEIYRLANSLGTYDAVIGSRWLGKSFFSQTQPMPRRLASRGMNLMVRALLGLRIRDTQCPAKVMKKEVAKLVEKNLRIKGFAFDAGMLHLILRNGYSVKEVPIEWQDIPMSSLSMSRSIPRIFISLLRIRRSK
jgi:glycosyltransferase involved in cell wall biosynthesis